MKRAWSMAGPRRSSHVLRSSAGPHRVSGRQVPGCCRVATGRACRNGRHPKRRSRARGVGHSPAARGPPCARAGARDVRRDPVRGKRGRDHVDRTGGAGGGVGGVRACRVLGGKRSPRGAGHRREFDSGAEDRALRLFGGAGESQPAYRTHHPPGGGTGAASVPDAGARPRRVLGRRARGARSAPHRD